MITPSESVSAVETTAENLIVDRPYDRISWGAILAGALSALAIMLVLSLLGLGVGLSTMDPASGDSPSGQTVGIGAVVWWTITNLIALFVGGMIAGRTAGTFNGLLHGLVTWATVTVLSALILSTAVGTLFAGATGMARFVRDTAPGLAQQMPGLAEQVQTRTREAANQAQAAASDPASRDRAEQQGREVGQKAADRGAAGSIGAGIALLLGAAAAALGGKAGRKSYLNSWRTVVTDEPMRAEPRG